MNKFSTKKLFIMWLILFFVVGFIVEITAVIYTTKNNLMEVDLPSGSKLVVCCVAMFLFCPSLFYISQKAKKDQIKPIRRISLFLLVFIYIAVFSNIIPLIKAVWGS